MDSAKATAEWWIRRSLATPFAVVGGLVLSAAALLIGAWVVVFSGMIGVTFFGIFMTPVFYVLMRGVAGYRPLVQHADVSEANVARGDLVAE
jgi:hypothetical protein